MKDTELAYLAGIVDGEGSISISLDSKEDRFKLSLDITNTNLEVLQWVQKEWGGSISTRTPRAGHRKPCHRWFASAELTEKVLRAILPYMRIKQLQAQLALDFRASFDWDKISEPGVMERGGKEFIRRHAKLAEATREYRKKCWEMMKAINSSAAAETEWESPQH